MSASQAVFDADLARFTRAFEEAGAIVTLDDGWQYVDIAKVPDDLARAYRALQVYGYANGLLP